CATRRLIVPLPEPEGPSMVSTGIGSDMFAACKGAGDYPALAPARRSRRNKRLNRWGKYRYNARLSFSPVALHPFSEVCHEGPVLPEVGEGPSPRLQGRSSPWQGLRDLQVEPAFQGAPALNAPPASGTPGGHRS